MPPKRKPQGLKRIRWVFTHRSTMQSLDAPDDLREYEATMLYSDLIDHCDCFAFQLEQGGKHDYVHFQGYFELTLKNRFSWIQNTIRQFNFLEPIKGKPHQAWAYSTKDATRLLGPWCYPDTVYKDTSVKDTTYADALAAATVRDGMAIIKANKPRDYCLYGDRINKNLVTHHKKHTPFVHKHSIDDFNHAPLLFTGKSMHVYGPSNTGKTSFVLAHFKNPLVVTHVDNLKKFVNPPDPDQPYDAIVFDDLKFQHWPPETVIQLVDTDLDRDIHIRYGTAHIPAHTTKVFTHNTRDIFYKPEVDEEQKVAIDRRVEYVRVSQRLFGDIVLLPKPPQVDLRSTLEISLEDDRSEIHQHHQGIFQSVLDEYNDYT